MPRGVPDRGDEEALPLARGEGITALAEAATGSRRPLNKGGRRCRKPPQRWLLEVLNLEFSALA